MKRPGPRSSIDDPCSTTGTYECIWFFLSEQLWTVVILLYDNIHDHIQQVHNYPLRLKWHCIALQPVTSFHIAKQQSRRLMNWEWDIVLQSQVQFKVAARQVCCSVQEEGHCCCLMILSSLYVSVKGRVPMKKLDNSLLQNHISLMSFSKPWMHIVVWAIDQ